MHHYKLNKHYRKLCFLIYVILTCTACKKGHMLDCLKSNGKEKSKTFNLSKFTIIGITDKMDVTIFQGSEYKVEIYAGENIIKNITCNVINDSLVIHNTTTCNFVRGYNRKVKVFITTPYVLKVCNFSVSTVKMDAGFKQDSTLKIRNQGAGDTYVNGTFKLVDTGSHGSGDVYLNGSTKTLLIYSNGTNFTFAEDFIVSDHVFVSSYSIGNVYLNVEGLNLLDYYIWKQGNIFYKGTPLSISNLGEGLSNGKGKLIRQD